MESLQDSVESTYNTKSFDALQVTLDKFAGRQQLTGLVVSDMQGVRVASSKNLGAGFDNSSLLKASVMQNGPANSFIIVGGSKFYEFAVPLHEGENVTGSLMIIENADYIDQTVSQIWRTNLLRWLIQVLVFSIAIAVIVRWFIFLPLMAMINSMKNIRSGKTEEIDIESYSFFKPLAKEISKISTSLLRARSAASQEAKLRMEKIDEPWTEERLKEFIKTHLKDRKIFVVSNREPYVHNRIKNEIEVSVPASGMVTALEPLMEACEGMWLAQGTGTADKETADAEGKIKVPFDDPKYTLKRIWVSAKEEKGFYGGFSNEALWPLCHNAHTRPIFRQEDWQDYKRVNGKFAKSLLLEIKDIENPLILVQDFHFALLPQMIKKARPDAQIGIFWHIPWPSPEIFSVCPFQKEILEGLLGADVIGFHTQQYCNNFMATVSKNIESISDFEQFAITLKGHLSYVRPFPISIAFTKEGKDMKYEETGKKLLEQFGVKTKYVGLGVDRMDYTKGILERFKGLEFFLDAHANYKEQLTFLQIAPPSREVVERYREFNEEVTQEAERINKKFYQNGWNPIVLVKKHLSHKELYPLYRSADFCLVTSLHDGMNLVSKEFVAARSDNAGVIILSQFTGAAKDLKGAIIINPYSAEETSKAIDEALNMSLSKQRERMKKMRDSVGNYNVYKWSSEFMKAILNLEK